MNRNRRGPYAAPVVTIRTAFVLFGVLCHSGTPVIAKESPVRPNVLVIIADDLGWNDISLHGGATPTPHIDSLASSGVSFRNLIVNPVCSPTRAALLTGCEAVRSGFGGEVGDRLNPAFPTIAQRFKAAGYRTGLFGKWHNGKPSSRQTTPWRPTPMKAGFDHFEGFYGGGTDFYNQTDTKKRRRNWYLNDSPSADEGYTTDLITRSAVRFIERHREQPFFCVVAHAAPHEPFQATTALLERVPPAIRGNLRLTEERVRAQSRSFLRTRTMDARTWHFGGFTEEERRVVYAAMLIGLDDGVGSLLETLGRTGSARDTIILFFSDNGAMRFIREGNLPLRAWKHDIYDGAIRVPAFLSYPNGMITPGSKHEPMARPVDFLPTLAGLAGVPLDPPDDLDGVNLMPCLTGAAKAPALSWNGIFVHYGGYRDDEWKLIARAGKSELYNIRRDPSETRDLAGVHPEVAADLRRKHEQWLAKHGANVNYSPPSRVRETPEPPRGEVLALEFDAPPRHAKSRVLLPLAREALIRRHGLSREDFDCTPGDCLSYDMKIEALSAGQAAYVSPTREGALVFSCGGPGIDTDGGSVASTKARPAASGMWKHHVMGIGNLAAGSHSPPALVVESSVPGKIRVLFDNIRILKPDGRAIPVWTGGKAPVPTAPGLALTTRRIN